MNVEDGVFGKRLEEERARLSLSKAAMAQAGAVSAGSYSNYLRGARVPDLAALAAWADAGIDVLFVVTGHRTPALLAPEEEVILGGYRKLDARGRAGVLALIGGMQPAAETKHRTEMVFKGGVGSVNQGDYHQNEALTIKVGVKPKRKVKAQ
ncbi:helix-turn-helix domain-containing protein [Cupriavidus pauculus]|uniref:helix-turn-helix domain-containing protein n=1 Tax=Cupriavidus pauculus TaxID=82633 RepID=UPI001D0C1CE4|nr:helix-turn-helix domain-containing protein [Cupriavidus pauculus]